MLAIDGRLFNVQKQIVDAYEVLQIKWKNKKKKYHTVRTVPREISKSLKNAISIFLTHKHMIAHFPCLVQTVTSIKSDRLDYFYGPKPSQMWYQILLS